MHGHKRSLLTPSSIVRALRTKTHGFRGNADQSDNRRPRSPLGNPASVDPTEARCDSLKGIVCVRPPTCRVGQESGPASRGRAVGGSEWTRFAAASASSRYQHRNSRFDSRNTFFPIGSAAPPRSIIAWKSRRRKCVCEERSTEKLGVRRPSGLRSGESASKRRQTARICGAG